RHTRSKRDWSSDVCSSDLKPVTVRISLEEFGKGQATWKQMPMNMIRKTAIVNALREAFPNNVGAMYTEDDVQPQTEREAVVNEEIGRASCRERVKIAVDEV